MYCKFLYAIIICLVSYSCSHDVINEESKSTNYIKLDVISLKPLNRNMI